jgi:dCMP deaminase
MRPEWSEIFMDFAHSIARRSTCRRTQVGALIVSGDNQRILAMGYNGSWKGGPNDCDTHEPGACGCLHAEMNCLLKLRENDLSDARMYVTHSPCKMCAKAIVNSGVKLVIYDIPYRLTEGIDLLGRAHVRVWRMPERNDPIKNLQTVFGPLGEEK